jgi:hypothetical protein
VEMIQEILLGWLLLSPAGLVVASVVLRAAHLEDERLGYVEPSRSVSQAR